MSITILMRDKVSMPSNTGNRTYVTITERNVAFRKYIPNTAVNLDHTKCILYTELIQFHMQMAGQIE